MSRPSIGTWCVKCEIAGHKCQAQIIGDFETAAAMIENAPLCYPCEEGKVCSYQRVKDATPAVPTDIPDPCIVPGPVYQTKAPHHKPAKVRPLRGEKVLERMTQRELARALVARNLDPGLGEKVRSIDPRIPLADVATRLGVEVGVVLWIRTALDPNKTAEELGKRWRPGSSIAAEKIAAIRTASASESNKHLAARLGVSIPTVSKYRGHLVQTVPEKKESKVETEQVNEVVNKLRTEFNVPAERNSILEERNQWAAAKERKTLEDGPVVQTTQEVPFSVARVIAQAQEAIDRPDQVPTTTVKFEISETQLDALWDRCNLKQKATAMQTALAEVLLDK